MNKSNQMQLQFTACPENEAFARMVISAFLVQRDPALSVISEVRTAVSEAVTNAIVHAYEKQSGLVVLRAKLEENRIFVEVEDYGCGIEDVAQAMQPFYTSKPDEERTGIGFALMQSFMDCVKVESAAHCGTCVKMEKKLEP